MVEEKLGSAFIRTDPDAADFNINKAINLVRKYIIESSNELTEKSTKVSLIDNISKKTIRIRI